MNLRKFKILKNREFQQRRRFKKRNKKPEKIFVAYLLAKMRMLGYDVDEVESKAVYSLRARRYIRGQLPKGFSDIVGNNVRGLATFIEAKAEGRKSTLRAEQRNFLTRKIKSGCIAMVVDSIDDFLRQHKQFEDTYYLFSQDQRAELLLKELPQKKIKKKVGP